MAGTLVANVLNTDTGLFSTNNAYLGMAKAWANYNGVTSTLNSNFNISSVTKNATANYTFNFSTAMANSTYSLVGVSQGGATVTNSGARALVPITLTTTSATVYNTAGGGAVEDSPQVCIAVFSS